MKRLTLFKTSRGTIILTIFKVDRFLHYCSAKNEAIVKLASWRRWRVFPRIRFVDGLPKQVRIDMGNRGWFCKGVYCFGSRIIYIIKGYGFKEVANTVIHELTHWFFDVFCFAREGTKTEWLHDWLDRPQKATK